jgi:hypothetical protein
MEENEFNVLLDRLASNTEQIRRVYFTEEEIATISKEQAEQLVALYGASSLMLLPKREREFFDWVRQNDPAVWEDLWGGDEEPYLVSMSYLLDLLPKRRGFLICDLTEQQNYFFTAEQISDDGKALLDASLDIVQNNGQLSIDKAFIVEIWRAPIDIWRFAYMYSQPLETVRNLCHWMLQEEILRLPMPDEPENDMEATDSDGELSQ